MLFCPPRLFISFPLSRGRAQHVNFNKGLHERRNIEVFSTVKFLAPVFSTVKFLAPLNALIQVIRGSFQSHPTFRFDCSKLLKMTLAGQWEFMEGQWEISGSFVDESGLKWMNVDENV